MGETYFLPKSLTAQNISSSNCPLAEDPTWLIRVAARFSLATEFPLLLISDKHQANLAIGRFKHCFDIPRSKQEVTKVFTSEKNGKKKYGVEPNLLKHMLYLFSEKKGLWVAIFCFLSFNLFAVLGNLTSEFIRWVRFQCLCIKEGWMQLQTDKAVISLCISAL